MNWNRMVLKALRVLIGILFVFASFGDYRPEQAGAAPAPAKQVNSFSLPSDTISLAPADADLSIVVTDTPDPVIAGTSLVYTVTVTNNGPTVTTGVALTDTLPASVIFDSVAISQGTCSAQSGVVTCSLGNLASGISAIVRITAMVNSSATGAIANTVAASSNENDPNPLNNSATATTDVIREADLSISMTHIPSSLAPGDILTYTLTLMNNGPSDASGIFLTDTLPSETTFFTTTLSVGSCSELNGIVICDVGALSVGNTAIVQVTAIADCSTMGTLMNSANVIGSETDPVMVNNTAAQNSLITAESLIAFASDRSSRYQVWKIQANPLMSLTQVTTAGSGTQESRAPDWSRQAGRIAYQFGASGVRGIHMIWPDGTGDIRLTCDPSDEVNPSWSPNGQSLVYSFLFGTEYEIWIHNVGSQPDCVAAGYNGEDYALLIRPNNQDSRPVWSPDGSKIAFVTSSGGVGTEIAVVSVITDANGHWIPASSVALLTNNSFFDTDPTWSQDSNYIAFSTTRNGTRDIYRMSATGGEGDAQNFIRLTTNPSEDRNPAWSPDGKCMAFVSERDGNREIYVMSAASGFGQTRIITSTSTDDDPTWGPNITDLLALAMFDFPDPVTAGEPLTYTVTITNNGVITATDVTLTDPLPTGLTYTSATVTQGTCNEAGGVVTCAIGALSTGSVVTANLVVTVSTAVTRPINNQASVIANEVDIDPSNNTFTETTTIRQIADLEITKLDSPDPVDSSDVLTYTLIVVNNGPSDATGISLIDVLTDSVTYKSFIASGPGVACAESSGTVSCSIDELSSKSSMTITIPVTVGFCLTGTILNSVTVLTVNGTDPNLLNNTSSVSTRIVSVADPQGLAESFSPHMYFYSDDIYRPIPVSTTLMHADLVVPGVGTLPPTLANLLDPQNNKPDTYLDLQGATPSSAKSTRNYYLNQIEPTTNRLVYARVCRVRDQIVIQYWFNYFYNDWLNNHEGDWEMAQVVLDAQTIPPTPLLAAYSQHERVPAFEEGGSIRWWKDVEKIGQHPAVFVADGSHASYFAPSLFLGGVIGVDETIRNPNYTLDPDIGLLSELGNNTWIDYQGRWGKHVPFVGQLGFSGPYGPSHGANNTMKWHNPLEWVNSLPWDEDAIHNGGLFRVAVVAPIDVHVYDLQSGEHVGWENGQIVEEIADSKYFDNPETHQRTIILYHDDAEEDYVVQIDMRPTSRYKQERLLISTVQLTFPDYVVGNIVSASYSFTGTWGVSTTAVISVNQGSNLHLVIDTDGDGMPDQDVPPTLLETEPTDLLAPGRVIDLSAAPSISSSVTLTWTAPGDDGAVGTAATYDIRYSSDPISDSSWISATLVISPPVPSLAGTTEVFTVTDLLTGTYYFAIATTDDVFRGSAISNVTSATIVGAVQYHIYLPVVLKNR